MRVQVISLRSSPHRRAAIADHLNALGLAFAFFDAVDGSAPDIAGHYLCQPDSPHRAHTYRERAVSNGELACTLSHMQAIATAWQSGQRGPLLVLEDDALLCAPGAQALERIMAQIPPDAAYVQLALTPTGTITALAGHMHGGGGLFTPKSGPITVQLPEGDFACHCTAGYVMTETAQRAIAQAWFADGRVVFPCAESEMEHNVALVADRLVYQAAVSQGGVGYVCNVPLVTTTAHESTLHPDHVAWHEEARDAALACYARLEPLLNGPDGVAPKPPRVFVMEPYIPNGGTFMAYHLARIVSETYGFEAIAVGEAAPDHGVLPYERVFPRIGLDELAAHITAQDVLIANPSFSGHHFGLHLPGRKLMYVQGFNTFNLLDCRFDHYVAVSQVVQRLLSGVYGIAAPIIPAFIGDFSGIERPAWSERPERSIIVSSKLPTIYHDHLQQCLRERGMVLDFAYLPPDKIAQADMMRLMGQHQYFLTLSPAEGFGLMPLEAMAMGAVVLGFDGYGGRDFMQSGENCAVVPYCQIEQLADLMIAVLRDPATGQRLSEAGQATAGQAQYHYPAFRAAWQREIAELVAQPRP